MIGTYLGHKTKILLLFSLFIFTSGCFLNAKIEGLSSSGQTSDPSNNISNPITVIPDPINEKMSTRFSQEGKLSWELPASTFSVQSFKVVLSKDSVPAEKCSAADAVSVTNLSSNYSNLDPDTNYYYRICSVGSGDQTSAGVTGTFKTLKYIQRNAAYPSYSNWNDYLLNNGTKYFNANQTVCPGNSISGFNSCINGGLVQKLSLPASLGITCDRVSAYDQLGVFRWNCDDTTGSTVIFSSDLNSNKGLQDLITDYQFKDNLVVIKVDGVEAFTSKSEKWWNNVIQELPDSPVGGSVALSNAGQTAGKIFIATTAKSGGVYTIGENKISVVTKRGIQLKRDNVTASSFFAVSAVGISYLWFEGVFNGNGLNQYLFSVGMSYHARFHNIEASNVATSYAVMSIGSSYNAIISDFNFHHVGVGIFGNSSSFGFLIRDGKYSHSSDAFANQVNYSVIHNVLFSGNNSYMGGSSLNYNPYNTIHTNLTFVNNVTDYDFRLFMGNYTLIHNLLNSNSSFRTIYGWKTAFLTISQIFSFGGSGEDIYISNSGGQHKFTNNLVMSNGSECNVIDNTANSPGIVNGTCANAGALSNANFNALPVFDQTNIFAGKVTSTDPINTNNSLGLSAFSSILDWTSFSNFYRGWGNDGGTFPSSDNRGGCSSGNCRIWDYRIKADVNNYAYNSTESVISKNGSFVAGSSCPSAVSGNKVTTYTDSIPVTYTFLTNAMEILGDGVGNDNSLCETGENCIYTPNFGAYQGEGDYMSQGTCIFQNGTVSNVKMYAYPVIGI